MANEMVRQAAHQYGVSLAVIGRTYCMSPSQWSRYLHDELPSEMQQRIVGKIEAISIGRAKPERLLGNRGQRTIPIDKSRVAGRFGTSLFRLMEKKGVSAYRIAKDCGYPISTIYKYLYDEKLPSCKRLIELAEYFKCSVDELLGRRKK